MGDGASVVGVSGSNLPWLAGRSRGRLRSGLAIGCVAAVTAVLTPVGDAQAAPAATSAVVTEAGTEAAASAAALASGSPVEVLGLRSETGQVFAQPDGTFRLEEYVRPVRVRQGSSWVAADATLRRLADGTVAPAVSSVDVSFSGGGSVPLVSVGKDGTGVTLGWPAPLPEPTLVGDTATYAEVLPGVDLVLRADVLGFSETMVVKTPAAGRSAAVSRIRFPVSVRSGSLRADAAGNLAVLAPNGTVAFHSAAPSMWDSAEAVPSVSASSSASGLSTPTPVSASSSTPPAAPTSSAAPAALEEGSRVDSPADGAHVSQAGLDVSSGELVVVPDQALLTAATTRYPVSIDPSFFAGTRAAWTSVWKQHPTTAYYNANDIARVGYESETGQTNRSFFRMNTSAISGKHVLSATFRAYETWSWSCSARSVQLWTTGAIGASTTWNTQPAWYRQLDAVNTAKGYSTSCAEGGVDFDATSWAVEAAAKQVAVATAGLRAADESDTFGWKKFRNNPVLEVSYNTVPNAPSGLSTYPNLPCTTGANRPVVGPPGSLQLRATVADKDGGNLQAQFEWYKSGTKVSGVTTASKASGLQHAATINAGVYATGQVASWRVRAYDGTDYGPWSSYCEVAIDLTAPVAPLVTSTSYPADSTEIQSDGVGKPGAFTIAANGATDVVSYLYGLDASPTTTVSPAATGGSVTVTLTPEDGKGEDLLHTLSVRSKDKAGNLSVTAAYRFYVKPSSGPVAKWSFDEGTGTTAADTPSTSVDGQPVLGEHPATLHFDATWTSGRVGGALATPGSPAYAYAATAGSVVRTDQSFSVAAWVRLTDKSRTVTAVAEDGTSSSGFFLQYGSADDRWRFTLPRTDEVDPPNFDIALSSTAPQLGVWTHLVGVYDVTAGQLRLYVNGVLSGTATHTVRWNATGPLQIGRAHARGGYMDFWPGSVDEVQVWDRIIYANSKNTDTSHSGGEIPDLATAPQLQARWEMGEGTGTMSADSSGRASALTLGTGATWTDGYLDTGGIQVGGTADGYGAAAGPVVRTDQSFTVAAVVRLVGNSVDGAVVAQGGSRVSPLLLQYGGTNHQNRWVFGGASSDADTAPYLQAESVAAQDLDEWVHVVGVYDAPQKVFRLYVQGVLSGQAAATATPWNGTGAVQVGRV